MQKGNPPDVVPDALRRSPECRERTGSEEAQIQPDAAAAPREGEEASSAGISPSAEKGPGPPPRSIVYVVEHRQHMSAYAGESALFSYRAELAFIASTLEKAVAWCRRNVDYAPHSMEKTWDFAVRKRELDTDLIGGGLVMVLDWDGEVTGWTV